MKKISKIKEYAARYLHEVIGMKLEDISKEVGVSSTTLSEVLNIPEKIAADIKTAKSSAKKDSAFIKHTASKGTKNVTIMTETASALGDEHKPSTNSKFQSAVYRPRG